MLIQYSRTKKQIELRMRFPAVALYGQACVLTMALRPTIHHFIDPAAAARSIIRSSSIGLVFWQPRRVSCSRVYDGRSLARCN